MSNMLLVNKIGWLDLISWFEIISHNVQDFHCFTCQYLLSLVPGGQIDIQKLLLGAKLAPPQVLTNLYSICS